MFAGHVWLGPRVIGKREDGTIPTWAKGLHLFFMLGYWAELEVTARLGRENSFDSVSDDLIIGRRLKTRELPSGIVNYVDLTGELEDPKSIRAMTNYISLPILDGGVPTTDELRSIIERLAPGTTYVHCTRGHGRTGLFTLALLVERGSIQSFNDGMATLRRGRPGMYLNAAQEKFIRCYIEGSTIK